MAGVYVNALAVGSKGRIYAGTYDLGIYSSANYGSTWSAPVQGPTGPVLELASCANGTAYAGLLYAGAYKTTDGGATWSNVSFGLPALGSSVDALSCQANGTIYAGIIYGNSFNGGGGVFISKNAGTTWAGVNTNLPSNAEVRVLTFDANGSLYAGIGSIYKTSNSGASWIKTSSTRPSSTTSIVTDAAGTLYAGARDAVYKSTDGGTSWTATGAGPFNVNAITIDSKGVIYAGGGFSGVYKSDNGGTSWSALNTGLRPQTSIYALVTDSTDTIFAATEYGLYTFGKATPNISQALMDAITTGTSKNLTLSARITPKSVDIGKPVKIYLAFLLPGLGAVLSNGTQYIAPTGAALPVHQTLTATATIDVGIFLSPLDLSGFPGTQVIVGYGTTEAEMLTNQQFKIIYTVQ
jgi:photosystem II stability/assembly factor-like uncharacterized protein